MFPRQLPDALRVSTDPSIWHDPITWATIVIAAAAFANVIVAYYMWRAAQDSARAAETSVQVTREIFEAGHRPYMGLQEVVPQEFTGPNIANLDLVLTNFGTALAQQVTYTVAATIGNLIVAELKEEGLTLQPNRKTQVLIPVTQEGGAFMRLKAGHPLTIKLQLTYTMPGSCAPTFTYSTTLSYLNLRTRILREEAT
jgi:hypothetical protein